jgi:MFS family permease
MTKNAITYGTLLSLYLAQSIPSSFFSTVVPVIMRQEAYSLTSIGLIQLVKIPWVLKFLWAPFIDRNCHTQAHYRRWIIVSELFYAAIIVSIGFFNLATDFNTIIILIILSFIASGTQDIATDAFAILNLKKKDRSLGNSMQSGGTFLGTMIGSGILLMAYNYFGWQPLLLLLASLVTAALIPLYRIKKNREPLTKHADKPKWHEGISFFKKPGALKHLFMLTFFYSGIIGLLWMLKPFLVDQGYTIKEIGYLVGIFGTSMGTLSSLGAGVLMRKISRQSMLKIVTGAGLLTAIYFNIAMRGEVSMYLVYIGCAMLWGTYGMAAVFIYTVAMNKVRQGLEGTDFTVQIVVTHLSNLLMVVMYGKLANTFGYEGLMLLQVILASMVFLLSFTLFKKNVSND